MVEMKKKYKKGDVVYDEAFNRLLIMAKYCINKDWLFCSYSFNPELFYYLEEKHLTLISKGDFK